jgi:hypothetical protein
VPSHTTTPLQTFFEEPTLLCAKKDSQSLKVFTFMERYSTTFNVVIEVAGADKKPHNISENYDIANYFYGDGELAHGTFPAAPTNDFPPLVPPYHCRGSQWAGNSRARINHHSKQRRLLCGCPLCTDGTVICVVFTVGNVAADIEDLVAELLKLQNKDSE